jgi:prevent-host-death family protein
MPLTAAAAQLVQVTDDVRRQGPQFINRDGRRVVAIIAYEDFVRLAQADGLV